MRIEAVIVCENYSDFLAHTLPETLQHVDHAVVVTSHKDKHTKDICNKYGVNCVQTDVGSEHGDKFNKGRMINTGIAHCRNDDWLMHLAADIVLPHRFRGVLNAAKPEIENLYGADRLNVHDFEQWESVRQNLVPQYHDGCHVFPHGDLELGARLLHGDYGFCPIGYFQMWHSSQHKMYPGSSGSAEHADVLFAMQWPRVKRVLLPQFFVYHLDSGVQQMGTNWDGRKSPAFCPCHSYTLPDELSYERNRHRRRHRPPHHHHQPPPPPPYKPPKEK